MPAPIDCSIYAYTKVVPFCFNAEHVGLLITKEEQRQIGPHFVFHSTQFGPVIIFGFSSPSEKLGFLKYLSNEKKKKSKKNKSCLLCCQFELF